MIECKYCGSKTYYRYFRLKGRSIYHYRFDGKTNDELEAGDKIDNGSMHESFDMIEEKTIFCSECHKKLGTIKQLEDYL